MQWRVEIQQVLPEHCQSTQELKEGDQEVANMPTNG